MSSHPLPVCHLAHVPGPSHHGHLTRTAVWICEYPYPTMRVTGPSADCGDCPIWQAMESGRLHALTGRPISEKEELEQLELMLGR